jgi:multidrug efflux pump subunit AcrB
MEALVGSAEERLRPILMTALTTIFGLIPMAFGSASLVGVPYKPLGLAVMGGLVASTVLTLVVVPLFYTWFDDLSRIGRSWVDVVVRGR